MRKSLFVNLLALLFGASGVLAFSPYSLWPFAFISAIALIAISQLSHRKLALWGSFYWGIGFFGFGINWVSVSINLFGGVPFILSQLVVLLFAAYLALFPLLFSYIVQRFKVKSAVIFAILWMLTEWLRGWLFTGFPWLQLGYSQIDSPFSGIAPIFGVVGLTFFVIWSSALIVALARNIIFAEDRSLGSIILSSSALITLCVLAVTSSSVSFVKPNSELKRSVTLVQGNIAQNLKWDSSYVSTTIQRYESLIAPHLGKSQLIILPEAALPLPESVLRPLLLNWQKQAEQAGSVIILGIISDKDAHYYNSIIILGDKQHPYTGNETNRYNKHHLVPFGEYVPLASILRPIGSMFNLPMSNISAGKAKQNPLFADGVEITPAICYEVILGSQLQENIQKNTDYLLTISNDAWFGDTIGPWQHLEMARMRALELGKPLLRATNTGITAFISPTGKLEVVAPQFVATTLTRTVDTVTGRTPYAVFGNKPLYFISLMLLLMHGLFALFKRKMLQVAQQSLKAGQTKEN